MAEKRCTKCLDLKDVRDFYSWMNRKKNRYQTQSWCKVCFKTRHQPKKTYKAVAKPIVIAENVKGVPIKYKSYVGDVETYLCLVPNCDEPCLPGATYTFDGIEAVYCCLCSDHWHAIEKLPSLA